MNSKDVNSKMKAGQPIPSSEAPKEMPVMNTQPVMNKETVMNIQTAAIVAQTLSQPTEEEQKRRERREQLEALRIKSDTVVEPEQFTLAVDGVGFFALKDIHAVKGKQKSGKSAMLKWCAAALLGGEQGRVQSLLKSPRVLFLDTEQQAADVRLVLDEVKLMSGVSDATLDDRLWLFTLRRLSYDTLVADTREIIDMVRPQVVVIDGLVDYVDSFNDEVASRQLVHDLLVMCDEFECAIVNVLHENKAIDDQNMRGHLGTVLAQKSGTVLQCQKQKDVIVVTTSDARHGAMPQWAITFDAEGHLQPADELLQLRNEQHLQDASARLKEIYDERRAERLKHASDIIKEHGGCMAKPDLRKELQKRADISRSTASSFIKSQIGFTMTEQNGLVSLAGYEKMPF